MTLKFVHWNILEEQNAFEKYRNIEKDILKWNYRCELIIQQLKSLDADIIGLTEVNFMPQYKELSEALVKLGYSDYFKENGVFGHAIFYKRDKLCCIQQNKITFD